ncbi:2-amino-4-hydroxy-6-hydroxymethyldihydropteridine diphosphokinase [Mangrovicoccus ximenensis]|uniref:2-amino-4-hydroxy-6- hydroxymethyldihydropteridine diphosphokinase n=1 Tax=Mangrovicoccus ximenensis TaxID=1911570 RepID=UPI001374A79A|nr:2-amino-4-hydroxy-6-hydroxymethyldihydropteridine diphosphokinase [Mangrovicoccus ximenensis]
MTDRVFVSNLCLHAHHGVFPEEKRLGQKFYLDIDCGMSVAGAANEDDYGQTVCYDGLCKLAEEVSQAGPFDLIETLGDRIAGTILERHPLVSSVRVAIRKPAAPIAAMLDHVGIEVSRRRRYRVAFSLGTNMGEKEHNLRSALAHLVAQDEVEIDAVSKFHKTAPWGKIDQDWFLNACATGWSTLEPLKLMKLCKRIELVVGRVPSDRWGPRMIDIDLLHADNLAIDTPELTLPHREMFNRAFVLEPLAEIAPELVICGRPVAAEADRLVQAQI